MDEPETLADLVELALRKQDVRTSTELSRAAERGRHELSHTVLNKMRKGQYKSVPNLETIRTLSYLSGVPVERVKRIVGTAGDTRPFAERLPSAVDVLTEEEMEAILVVLRKLVASRLELIRLTDQFEAAVTAARGDRPDTPAPSERRRGDLTGKTFLDTSEDDEDGPRRDQVEPTTG